MSRVSIKVFLGRKVVISSKWKWVEKKLFGKKGMMNRESVFCVCKKKEREKRKEKKQKVRNVRVRSNRRDRKKYIWLENVFFTRKNVEENKIK